MTKKERTVWQRWRYRLNGLLLLAPLWYFQASLSPEMEKAWSEKSVGPFLATPTPADRDAPYFHDGQWVKDFSVVFCAGCVERIRYAQVSVGKEPAAFSYAHDGVLHGGRYMQHVHVPYPVQVNADDRLWISAQLWDGQVHHASWTLP